MKKKYRIVQVKINDSEVKYRYEVGTVATTYFFGLFKTYVYETVKLADNSIIYSSSFEDALKAIMIMKSREPKYYNIR